MDPAVQPASQATTLHKGTPCFLFENHDEAYYLWREAGIHDATLVHVDAHHDMWPSRGGPVTVGSFVHRAMTDELVGEIYWVVPDASFGTVANVDLLLRNIETLPNLQDLQVSDDRVTANYEGHHLVACAAKNLPALEGEVLLDVDVDYFVLPIVSAPETAEVPQRTPWAWPQDLARWLERKATPRMITVAYSVNGGTTPIRWKYLGDEVRARLSGTDEGLPYFELIREAEKTKSGREEVLRQAVALWPVHPAAHWHLAEAQESALRLTEAQESYQRAVLCDDRYSCVNASAGPCLEAAGRMEEAAHEYKRLLRLAPDDRFALLGIASVAAAERDWSATRGFAANALANGLELPDGHRLLGDACAALGETQDALSSYEKYCAALKRGERSVGTAISSREPLEDMHEVRVRACMAKMYRESGNAKQAEDEYRWLSTKLVPNTPIASIRAAHAAMLWQSGQQAQAASEMSAALTSLPQDVGRAARKLLRGFAAISSPDTPLLNVGLNLARSAIAFLCTFATSIVLARALGPQAMGIYGYTLWVAGVMVGLCHFGLPTALSKFVAERWGSGDRASAVRATKKMLAIQLAAAIGITALGATTLVLSGASKDFPWIFAVLLVLPMAMQQALASALMGAHQYGRLMLAGTIASLAQLLFVILATWLDGSIRGFLFAIVVANVISAALYWWPVASTLSRGRRVKTKTDLSGRTIFRFAGPVAYLVILDMVVWQRSETYFLKHYSLWQEIGFYSIAYLIVSKLNEGLVAVTSTLMPLQSSRFAASGKGAVANVQWKSLRTLQMLLVPVCALTAMWAKPAIVLLYGADYSRIFPVLLLLLVSPVAVSMTDVSVATLYALERQRSLIVPLTSTAALNIALALAMVPRWGALGAAAANSAAQLIEGSFLLLFSAAVLSARVPWRSLVTIYAVGLVSFAPAGVATWAERPLVMIASLSIVGCLGYFALLLWTRELAPRDWQSVRRAWPVQAENANA